MTRVVKCIKPTRGLEVGKLYEVVCDNYDLIYLGGEHDGHSRDRFEYVRAYKALNGEWMWCWDDSLWSRLLINPNKYELSELPTETPEQHPLTKYTRKSNVGETLKIKLPKLGSQLGHFNCQGKWIHNQNVEYDEVELKPLKRTNRPLANGDGRDWSKIKALRKGVGAINEKVVQSINEKFGEGTAFLAPVSDNPCSFNDLVRGINEGIKHDDGKLKPSLLLDDMPLAIQEMLKVLKYGADKYAEGNWLKVDDGENRYRNACDRHRLQSSIEEYDSESGLLHLAHEAVNAVMLLELVLRAKDVK